MAPRSYRGRTASMGPQLDSCGRSNGGGPDRQLCPASMGPQLDSCGRLLDAIQAIRIATLQWGRNLTVAEGTRSPQGRNGPLQLQWGRNLTVAEGAEYPHRRRRQKTQLQWGRNLTVAEGVMYGFSGVANRSLQWGRNLTVAEGREMTAEQKAENASMGPQLDSCGRRAGVRRRVGAGQASMGPQLDSCGRPRLERLACTLPEASMGPQLDSCGRTSRSIRRGADRRLQWGRNLTVAEGRVGR